MKEDRDQFLLVNTKVLPKIYLQVLRAKEILSAGNSSSLSEACKEAGISRSVFYKYREHVFPYQHLKQDQVFTLQMKLSNKPGLLSAVLGCLYENGSDILTVNQNIPNGSIANVTVSITPQNDRPIHISEIIIHLSTIDGVTHVEMI